MRRFAGGVLNASGVVLLQGDCALRKGRSRKAGRPWHLPLIAALYEADENWEAALATYRRSLEADYNQPDLWALEKTMEAKVKRRLYGDSTLH